MKKNKIIFITATILTAFVFSSCFHAVFYNIKQDVFPEESTVKGVINSICRYKIDGEEYLFLAADEGLRYKLAKTGNERDSNKSSWKTFSKDMLPFSLHKYTYYGTNGSSHEGQAIIKVLADKDTLYLVTTDYTQDLYEGYSSPDHTRIWAAKLAASENGTVTGNFTEIKFGTDEGDYTTDQQRDKVFPYTYSKSTKLYFSHFNVFSTNSVNPEYRRVFVRGNNNGGANEGDCYYELKGLNAPSPIYITKSDSLGDYGIAQISSTKSDKKVYTIDSVAYLGDDLYFFDSIAVTTNEYYKTTVDNSGNTVVEYIKPSIIYFAQSTNKRAIDDEDYHPSTKYLSYIYLKDGTPSIGENTLNCSEAISSLAVTHDYILIGRGDYSYGTSTAGGIVKAALNDEGIPATDLAAFDTNASIQLSYSYQILTLLVTWPEKTEKENNIYSSITFKGTGTSSGTTFDNIGLWAYYAERDNWNCE